MEGFLELMKPLIEMYAGQFGIVVQIVAIVGSLRIAIKPLMEGLRKITEATYWTTKDDEFIDTLESSKVYKTIRFAIDWLASIKLPKQKKIK